MSKKNQSILVSFDTMKTYIRNGEKWVRSDWKNKDKYVIIADDRYCSPVLLLVYKDTDNYVIFCPTYKDYALKWRKITDA